MLTVKNPSNFRQLIFCSILADQPVIIQDMNNNLNPPGLKPQESRFLDLIKSISNGCKAIITKGSTNIKFFPGLITNNEGVQTQFDCGKQRSIMYFLEYLFLIAMFGKSSLHMQLIGTTNDQYDNCVDSFQNHIMPFLKKFYGFDNQLSFKILKRGYLPEGNGRVQVVVPIMRKLNQINLSQKGYITRIRGVCAGSKISSNILNRVVSKCRSIFNNYIPDVWIHTDFDKGQKSSLSPGYSLTLHAETTTGGMISFDSAYETGDPEQYAQKVAMKFLDQVYYGGVISTNYQWMVLNMMALSERKTSTIKLGRVSPFTIQCLRILKDFLGIVFEIQESVSQNLALFKCLGSGYENYARVVK